MVSNVPFERRYCPPDLKRRKRREKLTAVDRLVCAVAGGFLGFVLWTFGYLILMMGMMRAAARHPAPGQVVDPIALLPPFGWVGLVSLGFALFGAVVGAERMLDAFEGVLKVEGEIARRSA